MRCQIERLSDEVLRLEDLSRGALRRLVARDCRGRATEQKASPYHTRMI